MEIRVLRIWKVPKSNLERFEVPKHTPEIYSPYICFLWAVAFRNRDLQKTSPRRQKRPATPDASTETPLKLNAPPYTHRCKHRESRSHYYRKHASHAAARPPDPVTCTGHKPNVAPGAVPAQAGTAALLPCVELISDFMHCCMMLSGLKLLKQGLVIGKKLRR